MTTLLSRISYAYQAALMVWDWVSGTPLEFIDESASIKPSGAANGGAVGVTE